MNFHVEQRGDGLAVRIEGVAGREQALLAALRACRQSAWACPSGECVNVADIAERVEDGALLLSLTPRPAARLDARGIEQCLRYMLPEALTAR
jgi:hypothetical protein